MHSLQFKFWWVPSQSLCIKVGNIGVVVVVRKVTNMLIFKILSLIYLFFLAVWEPAKYTEFTKWVWVAQIGHQGVAPGKALQEKDSQVSPYGRHNSTKAPLGFQ